MALILIALLVLSRGSTVERYPLIVVSIDGFSPEYLRRSLTPALNQLGNHKSCLTYVLASDGVSTKSLLPQFPTKTFPNHYTMVTGLYPESHGIVSNGFYDPNLNAMFRYTDSNTTVEGRWWLGEPVRHPLLD